MPPPGEPQPDAATRKAFYGAMERRWTAQPSARESGLGRAAPAQSPRVREFHPRTAGPRHRCEARCCRAMIRAQRLRQRGRSAEGDAVLPRAVPDRRAPGQHRGARQSAGAHHRARSIPACRGAAVHADATGPAAGHPRRPAASITGFPADGEYEITISGLVGGGYVWGVMDPFTLIVTVDDERVFQAQMGGEEDLEAIDVKQAVGVGADRRALQQHPRQGAGRPAPHRRHLQAEDRGRAQRGAARLRAGGRHGADGQWQLRRPAHQQRRDQGAVARTPA